MGTRPRTLGLVGIAVVGAAVNSFEGDDCTLLGAVLSEFAAEAMSGCPTDD